MARNLPRISHATIAKANCADLDTIRRTLGHSTLAITLLRPGPASPEHYFGKFAKTEPSADRHSDEVAP